MDAALWKPDGELVYFTLYSAESDIWLLDPE